MVQQILAMLSNVRPVPLQDVNSAAACQCDQSAIACVRCFYQSMRPSSAASSARVQERMQQAAEDLAEDMVNQFEEEMGPVVDNIEAAMEHFGNIEDLLEGPSGYDLSSGMWQESGWREFQKLRRQLEHLRELRHLVRLALAALAAAGLCRPGSARAWCRRAGCACAGRFVHKRAAWCHGWGDTVTPQCVRRSTRMNELDRHSVFCRFGSSAAAAALAPSDGRRSSSTPAAARLACCARRSCPRRCAACTRQVTCHRFCRRRQGSWRLGGHRSALKLAAAQCP